MENRRARHHSNPDLRHRVPGPLPPVADIDAELRALLTPALLAPQRLERRDPRNPERVIRLRARLLTLPVMVALIVSLVWRRLGAIAEVARVLAQEGVLWVAPLQVSEQTIAKRLDTLPANALAAVFTCAGHVPVLRGWKSLCQPDGGEGERSARASSRGEV